MDPEELEEKIVWSFSSKKEYERQLAKLVSDDMGDSDEYERLMEEYLRFCATE